MGHLRESANHLVKGTAVESYSEKAALAADTHLGIPGQKHEIAHSLDA